MKYNRKKITGATGVLLVLILLAGYTLFQAKNLILGPQLTIDTPKDGETVPYEVVDVAGKAQNVASITLNDSPIFVDEQGNFQEKVVAPAGYSILKLSVTDRFGRMITEYRHIVLLSSPAPTGTTTSPNASTTPLTNGQSDNKNMI